MNIQQSSLVVVIQLDPQSTFIIDALTFAADSDENVTVGDFYINNLFET